MLDKFKIAVIGLVVRVAEVSGGETYVRIAAGCVAQSVTLRTDFKRGFAAADVSFVGVDFVSAEIVTERYFSYFGARLEIAYDNGIGFFAAARIIAAARGKRQYAAKRE